MAYKPSKQDVSLQELKCIHQTKVHSGQLHVCPKHSAETTRDEDADPLLKARHSKGI
jgi:hypothetical protein